MVIMESIIRLIRIAQFIRFLNVVVCIQAEEDRPRCLEYTCDCVSTLCALCEHGRVNMVKCK